MATDAAKINEPVRPSGPLAGRIRRRLSDAQRTAIANPGARADILATFLVVTGHFAAYTSIGPVLQQLSGMGAEFVGPLLLGFGVAGIAGNFLVGAFIGRAVRRTVFGIAAGLAAVVSLCKPE
ncbi:hypothetical protein [Nocardia sp. CA-290969]|uniref:hypothetical protein n=1 Tax=Nocardia sp. CA-290969 TaxID=3239986 RepID=UPI003D92FA71